MADVSAGLDRRACDDRGQLILIGGIVVALALVALVALLNTVLFAETVATRGIGPEIDRAHDHAAIAEDAGAAIVRGENAPWAGHEMWSSVDAAVRGDIDRTNNITQNHTFRRFGGYSTISVESTRQGAVLLQNDTRPFTSANDEPSFLLAETAGIRNFSMKIDPRETQNPQASDDRFTINVTGADGTTWWARIHAPNQTAVELTTSTGTTCTTNRGVVTINLTDGTFGNCEFQFAISSSSALSRPFRLRYEHGDNATGTYRLVVSNTDGTAVETVNFNGPSSTGSPRYYPGVYSLVLRATFEEGETRYATTVRVAPDEPPPDEATMIRKTPLRDVQRRLRRMVDGARRQDARGVTFTVSYVLTLGITVLLIAGVLHTAGQVVSDQRRQVIEDEATVVGDEVAASVMAADRLFRDGSNGAVTIAVDLPRRLADRPYTIELTADAIVVETTSPQVRVEVPLRSETAIQPETVAGGDLRVVVQSDSELIIEAEA